MPRRAGWGKIGAEASESMQHAEMHVVVDFAVDLEIELEYPVADEQIRRVRDAGLEPYRRVLDIVGVAEGHDVGRVKRGQRDARSAVAPEPVAEPAAEADRENVLILDRHQCGIRPRSDLERPVRAAPLLADLDQHIGDADQIAIFVDEHADARVVTSELADIEALSVKNLHRVLAEV